MEAAIPKNESARLNALYSYNVLDTPDEAAFDRLTRTAAYVMNVPIALVSLVDRDRQFLKSCFGTNDRETSRSVAFCAHAILDDQPTVVLDARVDPRFFDNPLVTGALGIRLYVGLPLINQQGLALGTLCVIDTVPHESVDDGRLAVLRDLADQVIDQLELRNAQRALVSSVAHVGKLQAEMLSAMTNSSAARATVYSQPKHAAGGDFLAHFAVADGRDLILLTDVSGHDLPAAYNAAFAHGLVKGLTSRNADLKEIFAELNNYYLSRLDSMGGIQISLSACGILIDSARSEISIRNCGCSNPVIVTRDGAIEKVNLSPAPPLGWFEDSIGTSKTLRVEAGFVLLWSDGLEDWALKNDQAPIDVAVDLLASSEANPAKRWIVDAEDDILAGCITMPGEQRTLAEVWAGVRDHPKPSLGIMVS